ncbi:MAG: hypothetical protein JWN29_2005 [Acidimicrobiales bacterium]|nr:hypothetical protein [Acidimicrobiales bacterium]
MSEPALVITPVDTDRRRLKILVGIAVALVLLLLVVPRVLGGSDGGGNDLSAPFPTSTTIAPRAADAPGPALVASSKNPFVPLASPAKAPPTTASPPTTVRPPSLFILKDVFSDPAKTSIARVQLDGKDLSVREGQQFARTYRVLALDVTSRCGSFSFEEKTFSLCAGEATTL